MADRDHPGVADLAVERIDSWNVARLLVILWCRAIIPRLFWGADRPAVADLGTERERALVVVAGR